MKKRLALLLAAVMIFALAACGGGSQGDDTAETIKLGGIAPLTGNISVYGIPATNGIKLAVEEINAAGGILGKQIEFVSYDDQSDKTEAVNAYNKLVDNDKVIAIVGDITSGNTIAVAQEAAADGIPLITPTGTDASITPIGSNIFRACFIDPFQGEVMATYSVDKLAAKTAAILYDTTDPYSMGLVEAFEKTAAEKGLTIAAKEGYAHGDVDFKTQLTNIAAKAPDVLFIPVYAEDAALISVQVKSVGITAKLLGADGWDGVSSKLDASNYAAVEGALFCNHYSPQGTDPKLVSFIANYKAKYNEDPVSFSALGYDAVYMLKQAIEAANSTDAAAIVAELAKLEFAGTTGTMKFDENRNPVKTASIITIVNGAYQFVETF